MSASPSRESAADELASRDDRSRSWIVAEAIRQYAARQGALSVTDGSLGLGASRQEQLRRDVALSPEARVLECEELVAVGGSSPKPTAPLSFSSYDAYLAWRREHESR